MIKVGFCKIDVEAQTLQHTSSLRNGSAEVCISIVQHKPVFDELIDQHKFCRINKLKHDAMMQG
jgi:hypothetical protein